MKAIKQAQTRNILDSYNKEDISYSRMNEMFNELADKHAIEFQKWLIQNCTLCLRIWTYKKDESKLYEISELLEIYKKENNL